MIRKHYYSWQDVEKACVNIALQMYKDNWRPDYIVGLNRGGLPLSVMLSHLLGCNHYTLNVRLRDSKESPESNLWIAEQAFGYVPEEDRTATKSRWDISKRKKILIVDDINDTGATFNWIMKDWQSGCLPNESSWDTVWGGNVRFATLTENLASTFHNVNYTYHEINKEEEDVWLVYPWENIGAHE